MSKVGPSASFDNIGQLVDIRDSKESCLCNLLFFRHALLQLFVQIMMYSNNGQTNIITAIALKNYVKMRYATFN